jgi:hypothetical protein
LFGESLKDCLCLPERLFAAGQKNMPHPIFVGRKFQSIAELAGKHGPKSTPMRVLAACQILPRLGNGFLKRLDALKHSFSFCGGGLHGVVERPNDQAQRPPPETPGRLQESRTNYLNRPPAQRGGGSLQRSG